MTHATKAIYKLLLTDYVKVSKVSVEDMLYNENDIARSMEKIEVCYVLACGCFSFRGKVLASGFIYLFIYFARMVASDLPTHNLLHFLEACS
jgi:hypothetical protein